MSGHHLNTLAASGLSDMLVEIGIRSVMDKIKFKAFLERENEPYRRGFVNIKSLSNYDRQSYNLK